MIRSAGSVPPLVVPDRYRNAVDVIVRRYRGNAHVVSILASGSIIHSTPDNNSDIDIHVVLDDSERRHRSNTWVDGVQVECLVNPVKQIRWYFQDETKGKNILDTETRFC